MSYRFLSRKTFSLLFVLPSSLSIYVHRPFSSLASPSKSLPCHLRRSTDRRPYLCILKKLSSHGREKKTQKRKLVGFLINGVILDLEP
ncbi:hypothetical protein ES288_D02G028200v1 [Gossypium darwinii]|uniref:Secreted protein n=1 Tax=Gossypium darwinii TaxID=34276 RepID=A0A5D2DAM8_GOSDA|nr:hypothetical protein ES288_D02G028200v1 [Gossypium darwinii]